MNEYISRDNAKNALLNKGQHTTRYRIGETWELNFLEILEVLDAIPAADVQPVNHGYWEEVTDHGGWGDTHYRCSVCGEEWYLEDGKPKDNNMNFCPQCGARMDGDTECQ